MLKERAKLHKVNQDSYALALQRLISWPSDCHKLAEVCGLNVVTMQDLMRALKRRDVVYICGWRRDARGCEKTPIFALKLKPTDVDVPRRPLTPAERAARYKLRKQENEPT